MNKRVTKFLFTFSVLLLAGIIQVATVFNYTSSFHFFSGSGLHIPFSHKKNIDSVSSSHFTISKATITNDANESEAEVENSNAKPIKKFTEYSKYFSHFLSFDIPAYYTAKFQNCLLTQKHFDHAVIQKRYILFEVFRI